MQRVSQPNPPAIPAGRRRGGLRLAFAWLLPALLCSAPSPMPAQSPTRRAKALDDGLTAKAAHYGDMDMRFANLAESRAIKATLDPGLADDEPWNRKICAMLPHFGASPPKRARPAYILAWFAYGCSDRSFTVNYFAVPAWEAYSDYGGNGGGRRAEDSRLLAKSRFDGFVREIAEGGTKACTAEIKQLELRLPKGLWNDALFDRALAADGHYFPVPGAELHHWGFWSRRGTFVRETTRYLELSALASKGFIGPIQRAILERETPKQWKKDAKTHERLERKKLERTLKEKKLREKAEKKYGGHKPTGAQ